jgi:flagellar hook-basal body complex protein FliE
MSNALASINPAAVLQAYQSTDSNAAAGPSDEAAGDAFSSMLSRALNGAITTGQQADAQSTQAISGHGDLTQVVTAVSQAELALQTTVAIRDRVLQAYQDIIKMPI